MHQQRMLTLLVGMLVLITIPGCFLFGGGGDNTTESAITASEDVQNNAQVSDEAMFLADMALEEGDFDTAIAEYNRAIRADSTNVDAYLALTRLYQDLAFQYREIGDVEEALAEQTRALRVLNAYINQQLVPAASTTGVAVNPPGGAADAAMTGEPEAAEPEAAEPDTTQTMP